MSYQNKGLLLERAVLCGGWMMRNQITDRQDANNGRCTRSYDMDTGELVLTGNWMTGSMAAALAALGAGWAALHALAGTRRGRATLWILLVLGGIWNAGLAAQYGAGMIPREGEVAFGELARNQFTRVPALVARQLGAALRRSPDLGAPPAALPNP